MASNLLTQLDHLAYQLQSWYMKPKKTKEKIGLHFAFFHPRPTDKIVLEKYLKKTQTILVTGCFDLIHSEHKKLLASAKDLGGKLLVGVESDARVHQLKGKNRPINPLPLRLKNLGQLGIADKVFSLPEKFSSSADHLAFLKKLSPDILAVSASTPNIPIKRQLMRRLNGRVIIVLPNNPKISSSKMLKFIK